jgi:hypothetical protein
MIIQYLVVPTLLLLVWLYRKFHEAKVTIITYPVIQLQCESQIAYLANAALTMLHEGKRV